MSKFIQQSWYDRMVEWLEWLEWFYET
jgi:hypothetical protein